VIETSGLTIRFGGVTPVDDLTVVFPGGTCGLIGPNGAGKTTFLNLLSGFVVPATGTVRVDGEDVLAMSPYRRARWGLRRTFQQEQVIEDLSVRDNIRLTHEHAAARGGPTAVEDALELVGLHVLPGARARSLDSRQRRLLEVARAIVGRPRLVLLDEPAAGMNETETEHLGTVIAAIGTELGVTVILVDHDMSLVSSCCTTTAVLDFGRLIASGPTADVLRDEHVRRAYLGTEEV
jgi:ABC-type branched-subunit amino acid transport system ATPase component